MSDKKTSFTSVSNQPLDRPRDQPRNRPFDRLRSIFKKDKPNPRPDDGIIFLHGDYERYAFHGGLPSPYYIRNRDEAGTPINQCYLLVKWSTHKNSTPANAADFDNLLLAYGMDSAKDLWGQITAPAKGHAVAIHDIEASEQANFEELCYNQEKALSALDDSYKAFAKIKMFWI